MGEFGEKPKVQPVGDGVNWDAVSHQQLWEWFSQPRLQELQAWTDTFNDTVVAHFQAAADKVDQALKAAGVHWEGTAADAMRDATSPLAEHALRARDAAADTGFGTMGQFVFAKEVAAAIPEPQPAPDQNIFIAAQDGNLAQHFQDVAEYETAANEAEARARDLARTYDSATDDAAGSLPRFEPAPVSTVSRAEPQDVIEVGEPQPRESDPRQDAGDPRPGDPGAGDPRQAGGHDNTPLPGSVTPTPGDHPGGTTTGQSWTPGGTTTSPLGTPPGVTDVQRPGTTAPVTGFVTAGPDGPGAGRPGTGSPGGGTRGPGTGGPPSGRGERASGPRVGVRGGLVEEGTGAARANSTPAARGGSTGMAPVGTGRGKGEEDKERNSPEYLRDYHDDFWDDTPPVAPAVIGDEDED